MPPPAPGFFLPPQQRAGALRVRLMVARGRRARLFVVPHKQAEPMTQLTLHRFSPVFPVEPPMQQLGGLFHPPGVLSAGACRMNEVSLKPRKGWCGPGGFFAGGVWAVQALVLHAASVCFFARRCYSTALNFVVNPYESTV